MAKRVEVKDIEDATRRAKSGLEAYMAQFADAAGGGFALPLARGEYDIFLSHAAADAPLVDAFRDRMQALDLRVYVDRLDDPRLDRKAVNRATAETLRTRMRACRMLVLAVTPQSANSRWIPWELGFFDAAAGEVFVLPLVEGVREAGPGIEFLDLYEWLDPATAADTLKAKAVALRTPLHRGGPEAGELGVTMAQVKRIEDHGAEVLRRPDLAMQWQQEMVSAGFKLQQAWWTAFQRAWLPPDDR